MPTLPSLDVVLPLPTGEQTARAVALPSPRQSSRVRKAAAAPSAVRGGSNDGQRKGNKRRPERDSTSEESECVSDSSESENSDEPQKKRVR
jgi:hypothetical protein